MPAKKLGLSRSSDSRGQSGSDDDRSAIDVGGTLEELHGCRDVRKRKPKLQTIVLMRESVSQRVDNWNRELLGMPTIPQRMIQPLTKVTIQAAMQQASSCWGSIQAYDWMPTMWVSSSQRLCV